MVGRLHVVTIDWLKMCLCKQSKVSEQQFKPEVVHLIQAENKQRTMKKSLQYVVKKNLFDNRTFAIIDESFEEQSNEIDLEVLKKKIIENGGHIVSGSIKAHYVIY